MKKLILISSILIVSISCTDESVLDVNVDSLKVENCECFEIYWKGLIECLELENEGLKLREKDFYFYINEGTPFAKSELYHDSIVKPAFKKLKKIKESCGKLGLVDDVEKCWNQIENLREEENEIFTEILRRRNKLNELQRELNKN